MQSYLLVVVALSIEAKAIRQLGRWQRIESTLKGCAMYRCDDLPIIMIVSGTGKIASAIATAHLCAQYAEQIHTVLNIGVAGLKDGELGDWYWVNKITDEATQKNTYPQLTSRVINQKQALITYDQIQQHYSHDCLMDMEAAGFMQAAAKWVSIEKIGVIKCISDNASYAAKQVTKDSVFNALNKNIALVGEVIKSMLPRFDMVNDVNNVLLEQEWFERWHFTFTQKHQLKKHLQAIQLLSSLTELQIYQQCLSMDDSKQILNYLVQLHQQYSGKLYCE